MSDEQITKPSPYEKLTEKEKDEIANMANRLCDLIEQTGETEAKVDLGDWKIILMKNPDSTKKRAGR